ncbi:MAG: prefoldin subunit beta [Desulfurococcales archaeon]|nr:prefoldin subunit beta [Desulfurococcales archaeon]
MGAIEKVPPQVEAKYRKFVQARELLARVAQEKALLEASLADIEKLLEELKGVGDDAELYRMKGIVLIKTSKEALVKELQEKKESFELKLVALRKQEESLQKEVERLSKELAQMLGGGSGGAPVGGAG